MRKLEDRVDRNLYREDTDEEDEEGHRSPGSAAGSSASPNKRRGQGYSDMSSRLRNQALNKHNNVPGANRKFDLERELY